ncbi:hypothetical protein HBH98_214900 [Parastagonospora nodorum]|nr:hypothetical protein HBH98_214900 [Parastagonospora nodorum]KAH4360954.1 hypothetical protein HBH97_200890 [Parastagonospora nodorum]KAH4377016.1 hypothetical protein HBH99_210250 [Parastagonospora nodorum]KAH5090944.1 hypothetical protein HBH72_210350 [Parastagonospora nodorum]KAH5127089.1 hypothetical protein HBH70_235390 [Parastagonospora nodorum]
MSRYRSVRRAQEQQQEHQQHSAPPVPAVPAVPSMPAGSDMEPKKDAPISRSMSRYHRRPTVTHATTPALPPPRANAVLTPQTPPTQQPSSSRTRAASSPQNASNPAKHRPRTARTREDAAGPASAQSPSPRSPRSPRAEDSARELLQKERERQRLMKEKYEAEARTQREAKQAELERVERLRREEEEAALREAQREAEEAEALRRQEDEQRAERDRGKRLRKAEAHKVLQQREEEARRVKLEELERKAKIEEQRPRTAKAPSSSPPVSPPRHDTNFGLFKRRKDDLTPEAPVVASKAPQLALDLGDHRQAETIKPGGGGAVRGIDAPTSAVNAGDRRVAVVCGQKRILLPVTPTTTPLDLIKTAATVLTEPIDVRTAVMQELFIKVSIMRPLRNYEYVRDVMNSWDADNQNDLTIIDSELDGIDQDDLLAYKVPEARPDGMSCFIQYSSRPGKWSKRYLTLKPDGQLVMAKNEKAKEKDQENILTMTDYDIYTVTQKKLAMVKPPKKICFAVKSLQKSNIFADESQYVHFFCTNDRDTATMFYKALQRWRSWYLKHQLGEGAKKKTHAQRSVSGGAGGPVASSHTRGESVGSHYQLGTFSSFMDLDGLNKTLDSIEVHKPGEFPDDKPLAGLGANAMHARKKSIRVKQPPPSAYQRNATLLDSVPSHNTQQEPVRQSLDQPEEETFAATGLLGRAYTTRQKAVQEREQKQNGPFTDGPSLISGMDRMAATNNESGLSRRSSVHSTRSTHHKRNSSDLKRTVSKRAPGMPEPLIDLTPTYRPPPQHSKNGKGKGYTPGARSGPLVESATSIEEAIAVPPSSDWRARPATASRYHGNYGRTRSLKGRGEPLAAYTQNNHTAAPEDDSEAFTGGLLAQAGYSQGPATAGRGVMDGSKATGPMINLKEGNQIAPGSLLSALPDSGGPIIDRSGK